MKTFHRWIRSGSYSLAAHAFVPDTVRGPAVLIVPPFGWEDVCCYRSLRRLAQLLAANGMPVLRYDLPGTADSSGDALDANLVESWIQSVNDAASELRGLSGVHDVAVVGIRLGALLALAAAARGTLHDMVLWGPPLNGRTILRELRAFHKLELQEYASAVASPSQPLPGLEVAGFLISPETQEALGSLDLSRLPNLDGRRILVLSRDEVAPDSGLLCSLAAANCVLEVKTGTGYAAMMAPPHDAVPPIEIWNQVAGFLIHGYKHSVPAQPRELATSIAEYADTGSTETFFAITGPSHSTLGVLSEPASNAAHEFCILFLNPGASRHIGPNRMWVEAARRWAARGVRSFRMDFAGIGESDGELSDNLSSLYQGHSVDEVELAIDRLRSHVGARQFALIGLCSGAFWAFHAAIRCSEVRGGVLLNPRLFFWDPEVDRRRMLRRAANGLTDSTAWRRLARGDVNSHSLTQTARIVLNRVRHFRTGRGAEHQIPPEAMAQAWSALTKNDCRLSCVFTEGEPLLLEIEEEKQFPPASNSRIRCIRIANAGHTFRPLWAQRMVHDLIDQSVNEILTANTSETGKPSQAATLT